jgi:hypothetical protein
MASKDIEDVAKAGGAAEPKKPAAKLPKASDADVAGFKAAYEAHIAERALTGIPPLPLNGKQAACVVELLKTPPAGDEQFLLDLLSNRIPPGVDEATHVKANFLDAVMKGAVSSRLCPRPRLCSSSAQCLAAITCSRSWMGWTWSLSLPSSL